MSTVEYESLTTRNESAGNNLHNIIAFKGEEKWFSIITVCVDLNLLRKLLFTALKTVQKRLRYLPWKGYASKNAPTTKLKWAVTSAVDFIPSQHRCIPMVLSSWFNNSPSCIMHLERGNIAQERLNVALLRCVCCKRICTRCFVPLDAPNDTRFSIGRLWDGLWEILFFFNKRW